MSRASNSSSCAGRWNRTGLLALVLVAACAKSPIEPSGSIPSGSVTVSRADLTFCLTETNRYRATVGRPALVQAQAIEDQAFAAAESDHKSQSPHAYFDAHPGMRAENEAIRWSRSNVRDFIREVLAQMWAEGPGGGHWKNIQGPYTQLGCGVYGSSGSLTFVQDFR